MRIKRNRKFKDRLPVFVNVFQHYYESTFYITSFFQNIICLFHKSNDRTTTIKYYVTRRTALLQPRLSYKTSFVRITQHFESWVLITENNKMYLILLLFMNSCLVLITFMLSPFGNVYVRIFFFFFCPGLWSCSGVLVKQPISSLWSVIVIIIGRSIEV